MIVKNSREVRDVYCRFGRGWINHEEAKKELLDLEVDEQDIPRVLYGQIAIAGF